MVKLLLLKPHTRRPPQLVIDIVVTSSSVSRHLSTLTYKDSGLYDVARTWQSPDCPIDVHTSYHPNGQMWQKMTRGRLWMYPGGQLLGEAISHSETEEFKVWERQGQPWQSFRGVERVVWDVAGSLVFNALSGLGDGYPVYGDGDADYTFRIGADPPSGTGIDIAYFLVEPGNETALGDELAKIERFANSPESLLGRSTFERIEIFTNRCPWLAIALLVKKPLS